MMHFCPVMILTVVVAVAAAAVDGTLVAVTDAFQFVICIALTEERTIDEDCY